MENDKSISLRFKVFNSVFLVGICMSFSCSLVNFILGLGEVIILIPFACGVITVVLYVI